MKSSVMGAALIYILIFIHLSHGTVYYVKPEHSECPEKSTNCWSMAHYISSNYSFDSNVSEFKFIAGTHHLPGMFKALNIVQVLLIAYKNDFENSSVVNIECTKQRSGLLFRNCSHIQVRGIQILDCTAHNSGNSHASVVLDMFAVVSMVNVHVKNSMGISFHSCQSQVLIANSSFHSNGDLSGNNGNARFSYDEYCSLSDANILIIKSSNFTNGLTGNDHASGISVFSTTPSLSILMERIHVLNNSGGNINITIENPPLANSRWVINLTDSLIANGELSMGKGMSLTVNNFPSSFSYLCNANTENALFVANTTFTKNMARSSGGGLYVDLQETHCSSESITITGSRFLENSVISTKGTGAAVNVVKHRLPSFYKAAGPFSVVMNISRTFFSKNRNRASTVELINVNKVELTNCTFKDNVGSAIALKNTNLMLTGNNATIFENNEAKKGAGISMCDSSHILINNNTYILFRNNKASTTGGAIHVWDSCSAISRPCFFQPIMNTTSSLSLEYQNYNTRIEFENNSAQVAGNALYGGEIDHCRMYWTSSSSTDVFSHLFHFSRRDEDQVSSDAYEVHFCDGTRLQHIKAFPGSELNIRLITKGQHNGSTPALVSAILPSRFDGLAEMHAVMDVHTSGTECTDYKIIFMTTQMKEMDIEVGFVIQQENDRYYTQNATLKVKLEECPWGFELKNSSCKCAAVISQHGFACNISTQMIFKLRSEDKFMLQWLGCEKKDNESCHGKKAMYTNRCGYEGYCDPDITEIDENNTDRQCTNGRTGIACGNCRNNFSVVLGTNRCLPCSNRYIGLIVICLLAGVGIMVLIMAFNITVSKGYLYSSIFYANVIYINQAAFFSSFKNGDFARIVIAWLNLDFGIEVCLYDGMTVYQKMWLMYGFVLYLFGLQLIVVILCRKYVYWTRLFGKNATKVMSTLFLLLYTKIGRLAAFVISSTRLHTREGESTQVWQLNGNIPFGSARHASLLSLATILGAVFLTFTLCLLFIQFLIRLSNIWCFKWVMRFHPFFETFTGPCNPHFVFWPGLLFSLLAFLTLFNAFHHLQKFSTYTTALVCLTLATFLVVAPKGVYKQRYLNLLEFAFFLNLGVISVMAGFMKVYVKAITTASVIIAIAFFLFFHLAVHFQKMKKWFKMAFHKRLVKVSTPQQRNVTQTEVVIQDDSSERVPFLSVQVSPVAQYYREPLIGSIDED